MTLVSLWKNIWDYRSNANKQSGINKLFVKVTKMPDNLLWLEDQINSGFFGEVKEILKIFHKITK